MNERTRLDRKKQKERERKLKKIRMIKLVVLILLTLNMIFLFVMAIKVTKLQRETPEDPFVSTDDLPVVASSDQFEAPESSSETKEDSSELESFEVVIGSEADADESLESGGFLSLEEVEKLLAKGEQKNDDSGLHVWVGDSRTVGIQAYTKHEDRDVFIAEIGMAYDWFERMACPNLELYLGEGIVSKVYINMGVNDCAANYRSEYDFPSEKYVKKINELVLTYPGVDFYFYSVGPSGVGFYGNVDLYALNEYVDGFNYAMENYCGATYIPCAEFLKEDGYVTTDGIHYDKNTCQKIYDFVVKSSTR